MYFFSVILAIKLFIMSNYKKFYTPPLDKAYSIKYPTPVHFWPDGKKHPRNIYIHSQEECEKLLEEMIVEIKTEITDEREHLKAGRQKSTAHRVGYPLSEPFFSVCGCLCGHAQIQKFKSTKKVLKNPAFPKEKAGLSGAAGRIRTADLILTNCHGNIFYIFSACL